MRRFSLRQGTIALLLVIAISARVSASDAPITPLPRVPDGFTIERVAGPEQVRFPMFAAFDDRGRLFVAESSGLDLYAEISALTRRCRVSMLEDRDGDGTFETSTVFAGRLVMPMGAMWRDGKLYVPDGPDLITLEDTNDDGKADKRSVVLSGFGHSDNGGLHGPIFGPDGWLYMTCGQPDGYKLKRPDGSFLEARSGALVRCRPDGSDPQTISRGFENLVEVVFLPTGEIIGAVNWYQKPEGGIRDALVHLLPGGLYPYVPDVGTPLPVTGPVLPAVAKFPAVALSGLMIQQSKGLGVEYQGDLFSAQHNTRKIGRHVFERDGATFRSTDTDFVASEDPDFHPSDVLEDADGTMLVIDTGSWYTHHCPTGQIRNSPATGGIYRVRRTGVKKHADPWGLKIDWAKARPQDLARLLADGRPAARERAARALVQRGSASVPPLARMLQSLPSPATAQRAMWVLAQVPDEAAGAALRAALGENNPDLVVTAARALGARGDRQAAPALEALLSADEPSVRSAAAEALAECGGPQSLPSLWRSLAASPSGPSPSAPDRMLEHAIVHAIHRHAGAAALQGALSHASARVQAAAMLLLDQPPRPKGALSADAAFERLASDDELLRSTALRRVEQHPEWADHAIVALQRMYDPANEERMLRLVLAFESDRRVREIIAQFMRLASRTESRLRARILGIIARSRLPEAPPEWVEAVERSIEYPDPDVREQAVKAAAALRAPALDDELAFVAASADWPVGPRLEALRGLVGRRPNLDAASFDLVLSQLGPKAAPSDRLAAAALLGRASLDESQAKRVLAAVRGDALLSPTTVLPPLARAAHSSETVALELIGYLSKSLGQGWEPAPEQIEELIAVMPPAARPQAEVLRTQLRDAVDRRRTRLAEYEPLLTGGDAARGRTVFFGNKAACGTCHRVGAEGGIVGPDLTKVGAVRAGRDILESIVLPSSTFAQGFDSYVVQTASGEVYAGTIPQPGADVIEVRDSGGKVTRLHKDQVKRLKRQPVSIMPEGSVGAMTKEEFRDLLAFLQGLK